MGDLIGKFYYWTWHDWLKLDKPITNLTREDCRRNPLLYILIALLLGAALVKFSKDKWWLSLIWLALGVTIGHIWW